MTEGARWACEDLEAWGKARKATVMKSTEVTFVLKASLRSSLDSANSFFLSSVAFGELGSALAPEIPAAAIRRSRCFSLEEIWEKRDSRSSFFVTSQGQIL